MALIISIDSKTRVHIELNLQELIEKLIEKDGIYESDTSIGKDHWIYYDKLEEVVNELNKDSYFLIRNDENFARRKVIINCPKIFRFYRKRDFSSSGL